jgi:hypothetical protein
MVAGRLGERQAKPKARRLRAMRLFSNESAARCRSVGWGMADLVLVYGMRLLPADEVASVQAAPIALKNGNEAQVTMHILEGSREQIESQLRHSIDAFFDFYPEI